MWKDLRRLEKIGKTARLPGVVRVLHGADLRGHVEAGERHTAAHGVRADARLPRGQVVHQAALQGGVGVQIDELWCLQERKRDIFYRIKDDMCFIIVSIIYIYVYFYYYCYYDDDDYYYLFFFLVALSTRGLGHIVKMKSHEMHAQLGQLGLSLTMLLLALRSELSLVQCLRVKSQGVFKGRCNALMNSFQGIQLCEQISFTVLVNKCKEM